MAETLNESLVVNGEAVAVIEWTVRDYRNWYKELNERDVAEARRQIKAGAAAEEFKQSGEFPASLAFDLISLELIEGIKLFEIAMMTSLSVKALEDMTTSQINEVVTVCKKVNPNFFALKKGHNL